MDLCQGIWGGGLFFYDDKENLSIASPVGYGIIVNY
jgi:hypothetical protein